MTRFLRLSVQVGVIMSRYRSHGAPILRAAYGHRSDGMGTSLHGVWSATSSDAELIAAVRGGDSVAFGQLYQRHSGAARSVARQYSNSSQDAEDVVSDAFSQVFTVLQGGGGPDVAFRAYLFTVVRRVAIATLGAGKRVQPTDDLTQYESSLGYEAPVDEPALAGFERGVVARAYESLPERWQAVLWYTEVEGLQPAQIGPILGLTANGVAALAYRARDDAALEPGQCRLVDGRLGPQARFVLRQSVGRLDALSRAEGRDRDPPDDREQIGAERDVGPATALQHGEHLRERVRDDVLRVLGGVRVLARDRASRSRMALVELPEGDRVTTAHGGDELGVAGGCAPDAMKTRPHPVAPVSVGSTQDRRAMAPISAHDDTHLNTETKESRHDDAIRVSQSP